MPKSATYCCKTYLKTRHSLQICNIYVYSRVTGLVIKLNMYIKAFIYRLYIYKYERLLYASPFYCLVFVAFFTHIHHILSNTPLWNYDFFFFNLNVRYSLQKVPSCGAFFKHKETVTEWVQKKHFQKHGIHSYFCSAQSDALHTHMLIVNSQPKGVFLKKQSRTFLCVFL